MGGNLSVRSEIGMGTRVKVTLPVNSVGESATPSPDEEVRLHATKVFFYGFEQRGLVRLQSLLTERYSRRNIEKVAEPSNADLFLVSDVSLHGFVADAGPLSGCKSRARVVVATSDLSKPSEVLSALEGFPVHVMKPPFGPVAFKALDNFLKEEAPKVMRKPTASAAASASSALLQAAETPSPERRPPLATLRSEQEKGKMVAEALVQSSGPPPPYMPLAGKEFKILIVEVSGKKRIR